MSMDKRGDNAWRFRINYQGQSYVMNFKGTEREAKKAHEAFKVDIRRGQVGENENMKFYELTQLVYDEYCKKHIRAGTQRIYKSAYNIHLNPYFGDKKLCSITPIMIQRFINEKSSTYKHNTVSGIANVLSTTLKLAINWGIIKESPYRNIKIAKDEDSRGELIGLDDIRKLMALYEVDNNLMHKSSFYLAIACGLRNSEIRALTIDDIDFKENTININKQLAQGRDENGVIIDDMVVPPKTKGSNRIIYAPQFVMDALREYIDSLLWLPKTGQIYINTQNGKPITKHCLSKRFKEVMIGNGLTPIRFHDLRHLQATLLMYSGINIQSISQRLGHSNTNTTLSIYTHNISDKDKEAAKAFEATVNKLKEAD